MMEHTKEPWSVGENYSESHGRSTFDIISQSETVVGNEGLWGSEDLDQANAHRIVACVNACKGVSNAYLERIAPNGGIISQSMREVKIEAERDAALAMVRELREALETIRSRVDGWSEWNTDAMDRLITKAEALNV